MTRTLVLAAVLAIALPAPALLADEVEDAIQAFVGGDGFERRDVDALDRRLLEIFAQAGGAMRPDGDTSAVEKALLLIDAMEPALPRVRYMLRYGQIMAPEPGDPVPLSFVTVERYNFGPLIRQDAVESYGEENVDDPEVFGVGPHVAWRIVARPLMGQTAAIVEAARREIAEEEAAAADCGERACLAYDMPLDEVQDWQDADVEVGFATLYPAVTDEGVATPAAAAAELLVAAGLATVAEGAPAWSGPEHPEAARGFGPFLFVGIDRDLGQETNIDAMLGQTLLNDDAVAELWYRRNQFPESAAYWQTATRQRSR